MLPARFDGCASKMLPNCSVFFLRFVQKLNASPLKAYCLTFILYRVSIFSEVGAIWVIGFWNTTSCVNFAVEPSRMVLDVSFEKQKYFICAAVRGTMSVPLLIKLDSYNA